jgi:hypothetical protein
MSAMIFNDFLIYSKRKTRGFICICFVSDQLKIQRTRRKAVRLRDRNSFESYMTVAAERAYCLTSKTGKMPVFPVGAEVINNFNLDEIRGIWRELSQDLTFQKTGVFLLMQGALQRVMENFILLDRLLYFRENGIKDCCYKKLFEEEESPRCFALIARKPL